MSSHSLQQAGVPPDLRWSFVPKSTSNTFAFGANLAIVAPEHMCRTDQPMFVSSVEFDPTSVGENTWPANQGDVVVMNHIEVLVKEAAELARMKERVA